MLYNDEEHGANSDALIVCLQCSLFLSYQLGFCLRLLKRKHLWVASLHPLLTLTADIT
jgi:hypothetical protein